MLFRPSTSGIGLLIAGFLGCVSTPEIADVRRLEARASLESIADDYPDAMRPALSRLYQKKQEGSQSEYLTGVRLDAPPEEPFGYLNSRLFPGGGLESAFHAGQVLPEETSDMVEDLLTLSQDYTTTPEARLAKAIIEEIHPTYLCDEVKKLFGEEEFLGAIDTTNYQEINTKVQFLIDSYPYHPCVREARRILANSYYRQENYTEARIKYEEYQVLYPNDPEIDYVSFQIANCHYQLISRTFFGGDDDFAIGRDSTSMETAERLYREFLTRYPDSRHASVAKTRYEICRRAGAEKRIGIARLYLKRDRRQAALVRLDEVIANYADTKPSMTARLTKAEVLADLGESGKARAVLKQLMGEPELDPDLRGEARSLQRQLEKPEKETTWSTPAETP